MDIENLNQNTTENIILKKKKKKKIVENTVNTENIEILDTKNDIIIENCVSENIIQTEPPIIDDSVIETIVPENNSLKKK